ncbi:hypothetical protein V5799_017007 [Amblyomma americanum]|uniref:Major facilitator superfamily (MFS) profile domain-containing protein n=1 Tax=Amblyomma americanum TaxID=6943 RepID=A0AAQ4F4J1_AMBAM
MREPNLKDGRGSIQASISVPFTKRSEDRRFAERMAQNTYVFGDGRFQVLLLLFAQAAIFVSFAQTSTQISYYFPIAYWCRPPSEYSYMSTGQWFNSSIPRRPDGSYSHCSRYGGPRTVDSKDNATEIPCEHWDYNRSAHGYSVIMEWDLVCNRAWLLSLSEVAFMTGSVVCVPLMGLASDRFGRRPVLCGAAFVLFWSAVAQCFAQSLDTFVILRSLSSASASVLGLTTSVVLFESTPPGRREAFVALAVCMPTILAPAYVTTLAAITFHWRNLHLAIAAPSLLLIVTVYLTGESLQWLIMHARSEEAERVALWAARVSNEDARLVKLRVQAVIEALLLTDKARAAVPPDFSSLNAGTMRSRSLVIFGCWLFSHIAHHSPNADLVSNVLRDMKWAARLLNALAMVASYFVTTTYGHRYPFVVISLLYSLFVTVQSVLTLSALLTPLAWSIAVAYTLFNMAYVSLYIHTVDTFPAHVRNTGFSVAHMGGSLGAMLAGLVKQVEIRLPPNMKALPRAAIGMGIAGLSVGVLFLPKDVTGGPLDEPKDNASPLGKLSMLAVTPDQPKFSDTSRQASGKPTT